MTSNVLASELAEKASQTLELIYSHLGRMADEVVRCRPPRATLTETHFGGLQRIITDLLNEEPGVWGMGFAAAPGSSTVWNAVCPGGSGATGGSRGCG